MIEINRNSEYTYRIDPNDPKRLQRRANRHNARWHSWAACDSAEEAQTALLGMERDGEGEPKA